MRIWHMKPRTKHRLLYTNRPSFDERLSAFRDAFLSGGYEEVGRSTGPDRGDARLHIEGKRPTEAGDIISDGNHLWKVERDGETYLGEWG